jgi:hypothetical protein
MRANGLPDFVPSERGFRFQNRWPAGPAFELHVRYLRIGLGEVSEGLCGGMCFAAADRYLLGEPAPDAPASPPARGTPLFGEIARRQLDSLGILGTVSYRFWWTAVLLRTGRWTARHQVAEWRRLCADIDAGRPAMAGLMRSAVVNPFGLTANHQVLGFAYEADATTGKLRIYDPNHPGRDDVELRIARTTGGLDGAGSADGSHGAGSARTITLEQSTGEPLLALLRLPYRPATRPQG